MTLVLIGCIEAKKSSTYPNENKPSTTTEKAETSIVEQRDNLQTLENELLINEKLLQIRFGEFTIEIDSLEIWDEQGKLKEQQKDTAIIQLELGATIEGQKLKVRSIKNGKIRIYQRFENSVTVMNEGPHCDLTEWKHYNSEWKELKIENGQFLTDSYTEKDWGKFIKVDMNELREAVNEQCGDVWVKHLKNVKSPTEYPCGVSTSRIFLKIVFSENETKKLIERIISFQIPMGC